jgi:hypothetical protein
MKDVIEYVRMLYAEKLIDSPIHDGYGRVVGSSPGRQDRIFMTHDQAASRIKWAHDQWKSLA